MRFSWRGKLVWRLMLGEERSMGADDVWQFTTTLATKELGHLAC